MDIEAGARKHDVPDENMLHSYRYHWRAFATGDASVTMFVGSDRHRVPLEVGVVVDAEELRVVDTTVLRHLAELAEQRATVESELRQAVAAARQSERSWSEIGAMLGVSKQAAQRKYGRTASVA